MDNQNFKPVHIDGSAERLLTGYCILFTEAAAFLEGGSLAHLPLEEVRSKWVEEPSCLYRKGFEPDISFVCECSTKINYDQL